MKSQEPKNSAALFFLIISIFAILWSTLLQKKIPWEFVMAKYAKQGIRAFFYHTTDPGSVCWFGIASGVLITFYAIVQVSLVSRYIQQDNKAHLQRLLNASIGINIVVLILMFLMNSWFVNKNRSLFENSFPFFICQFIAIGLLYGQTR